MKKKRCRPSSSQGGDAPAALEVLAAKGVRLRAAQDLTGTRMDLLREVAQADLRAVCGEDLVLLPSRSPQSR